MNQLIALVLLLICATAASGAEPASSGEWTDLSATAWTAFGRQDEFRLAVAVDRQDGNLFVARWSGVWMSPDQGRTFVEVDGGKVGGGGPFSCYAMIADPRGGKLAVFDMNNKPGPSGCSFDGGRTWESFAEVGRNWDYGAVGWDSKAVLAVRHEEDGVHYSPDLGKTWSQLALHRGEVRGVGVFGAKELVVSGWEGISRSEDAGKTWAKVAPFACTGVAEVAKDRGLWLANSKEGASVVATTDAGKTWKALGKPVPGAMFCSGPFLGRDDRHLVVATLTGIMESTDGGEGWSVVATWPPGAPQPNDSKNGCQFPGLAYDVAHETFYVTIGIWKDTQLWKFARPMPKVAARPGRKEATPAGAIPGSAQKAR